MNAIGLEVLLILVLIVTNGLLSMSEIAIVSARKARLQRRADDGDARARTALELATHPDALLSTVQIGITLVGILAGAFGGARVAGMLAPRLAAVPWIGERAETVAVALVVLVITYFSVVLGELVPKKLALGRPEAIASVMAGPMRLLSRIALPFVRLLSGSTRFILWLFRIRPSDEPQVTEDEIRILIRQGTRGGVFEETEQALVEQVFRLGDRKLSTLMTPRTEVDWIDLDDSIEESAKRMAGSSHSYFPVCREGLENLVGVIAVKRLWAESIGGRHPDLESLLMEPLYVPESLPALRLLEQFKRAGTHIAFVIDEYGGLEGMVTLNDVLGAIVGDVTWSGAGEEPQVVRRDDGSWLLDGMLPVSDFRDLLKLRELPGEAGGTYQTVGGFVTSRLGRIPRTGDQLTWQNILFEVVDMDGLRVDKVLVARHNGPGESGRVES
jgi:putative hemolysin